MVGSGHQHNHTSSTGEILIQTFGSKNPKY